MIFIISAGDRIPSNPELDGVTPLFGSNMWHHMALGNNDCAFISAHHERFGDKVHGAVLSIIDEMRDEVATELLREPAE